MDEPPILLGACDLQTGDRFYGPTDPATGLLATRMSNTIKDRSDIVPERRPMIIV